MFDCEHEHTTTFNRVSKLVFGGVANPMLYSETTDDDNVGQRTTGGESLFHLCGCSFTLLVFMSRDPLAGRHKVISEVRTAAIRFFILGVKWGYSSITGTGLIHCSIFSSGIRQSYTALSSIGHTGHNNSMWNSNFSYSTTGQSHAAASGLRHGHVFKDGVRNITISGIRHTNRAIRWIRHSYTAIPAAAGHETEGCSSCLVFRAEPYQK